MWQVDTPTDPTGQTRSQLDRPLVPAGRPLVWTVETLPVADLPSVPAQPATAGQSFATASPDQPQTASGQRPTTRASLQQQPSSTGQPQPAADKPAPPANPDLQPDGYPRFGVPVDAQFPLPYIGGAMPSAYLAGWGSYYVGLSGATPGKLRAGSVDASLNMGMGFGDFFRTLALQVDFGVGSIKNFGANGGFSVSTGRLLVDQPRLQVAAAGGVFSVYTYGNEGDPEPSTGYGVVTFATPLRPNRWDFSQTLQLSLGYGGWQFAYLDPVTFEGETSGFFTALGLQVTKNVGLSAGWSARGTNLNLSYVPFRDLPFYINVVGADLFDVSPWGPRAVFSFTWGDDFRTALF